MEKLGLIPLMHMFNYAIASGVPLIPRNVWDTEHKDNFAVEFDVQDNYNHYVKMLGTGASLGTLLNAHMKLYFAWRFRSIRRKSEGDSTESKRVESSRATFNIDARQQAARVAKLSETNRASLTKCQELRNKRAMLESRGFIDPKSTEVRKLDIELANAEALQAIAQDGYLQEQAKLDTIPNMNDFNANLAMYDRQLLADVREIESSMAKSGHKMFGKPNKRADLRPHYRALLEAYENEFIHKKGMADPKLIYFFDTYVHDSLPGFAKDATLPSDPRVVFVGTDAKLGYASLDEGDNDRRTG
ncbi:MAG: hypothetical protein JWQ01_2573 [Massilia sp.]|nr:hypothetical protein [Massilia sp.]